MTVQAVKSLLSRARVNLKLMLEPYVNKGTITDTNPSSPRANEPCRLDRIMNPPSPPNNRSTEIFPVQGLDAVSPEDELLVAYLDGELDDSAKVSLEKQLSSNEVLRSSRLDELRSAWDLLERVTRYEARSEFCAVDDRDGSDERSQIDGVSRLNGRGSRCGSPPGWRFIVHDPRRLFDGPSLVSISRTPGDSEVHLLADWDALKAVGSYEFWKVMTVKDLQRVSKRSSTSEPRGRVVPDTIAERRNGLHSSARPIATDFFSANLEDFKQFKQARPVSELNKIIELGNRIYESPEAESLLHVARSYAVFLSDMSVDGSRDALDITDLDMRVAELQRRVNRKL